MNELGSGIPSLRIMAPLSDSLTAKSIQARSGSPSVRRKNLKWCWCITTPLEHQGGIRGMGNYLLYMSQDACLKGKCRQTIASAENTK